MNKSGLGFPSIFTVFILVLVIIVLAMAQNKVDTSTIDNTIESLNWSKIGANISLSLQNSAKESNNDIAKVIFSIIDKAVDFFGYSIFAVGKLAMGLAKENPDIINYKLLMALLILSLLAPLIYPAFILIVSIILIVKEWLTNKREKKLLLKYASERRKI